MKKPASLLLLTVFHVFMGVSMLNGQTAQFSSRPVDGNLCAPARINFVPTFSEKPEYFFWKFGQNEEESEINSPTVTYNAPGTYQVTLTVVYKNVIREVKNNVTVYGPTPVILQPEKDYLCKPGDNSFTLKNMDTLKRAVWDFGNGNKIENNKNTPVKNSFPNYGSYTISVEVENIWGCKSDYSGIFKVERPKALIKDTLIGGCVPAEINFAANILVPTGSRVTKYVWDFKDGSAPQTTTENKVKHTYSKADSFVTSLSITTSEGCENNFTFPPVAFGKPPVLSSIVTSKDTICASDILYFKASSPGANRFFCEISDGTTYETNDGIFSHDFRSLGTFNIKVTPEYNGCRGPADSIKVLVRGVIARYSLTNTCAQKNRFSFRNTSIGTVNSIQWNFEGSSLPVTINNPEYIFPAQGRFPVSMIVKQNATGCADTATGFIFTAKPSLEPVDTFVCLGNSVTMRVKESYLNPRTTYNWTLAGKVVSSGNADSTTQKADMEGIFTNQVIISNGAGYCRDTLVQPLKMRVAGLTAAFETIATNCTNEKIVIQNGTKSLFGLSPETKWNWVFGNGDSSALKDPAPVEFKNPGNYRISLMVTDSKGCVDSLKKVLRIRREPLLKLEPREQKICQGQEFSLTAFHTSDIKWSPSNLVDCDTCSSVKIKPVRPTVYRVVTKDSFGCSAIDSIQIDVWYSFELERNLLRDTAFCYGGSVQYDLKTNQKIISWSPAAGLSAINIPNPVAKPELSTTYIATVTDSARCFVRTDTVVVTIYPLPKIDHDSLLVVPFEAPFTISPVYSNDISTYRWQTTSQLSCLDCPNPSGIATSPALFEIKVVSNKGCTSEDKINLVIDCSSKNINMPTAFSPDKNGLNDYYYPLTRGIRQVKRFAIFNRFGEIIFERKDFIPNNRTDGWDGRFKGNLQPAGVYTYWVELLCASGNLQHYKGSFFLYK